MRGQWPRHSAHFRGWRFQKEPTLLVCQLVLINCNILKCAIIFVDCPWASCPSTFRHSGPLRNSTSLAATSVFVPLDQNPTQWSPFVLMDPTIDSFSTPRASALETSTRNSWTRIRVIENTITKQEGNNRIPMYSTPWLLYTWSMYSLRDEMLATPNCWLYWYNKTFSFYWRESDMLHTNV